MESRFTASDLSKIPPSPGAIIDDIVIPDDLVKKLENIELTSDIPIQVKLISTLVSLLYRYQEEDETEINVSLSGTSTDHPEPVELTLTVNEKTIITELFTEIKEMMESNLSWKNWFESQPMNSFICSNLSSYESTVKISLLFEMSLKGSLVISAQFLTNSYDIALKWGQHFQIITEGILNDRNIPVGKLPILSDEEIRMIRELSTTLIDTEISKPECLQVLFKNTVDKYSEQPALRCREIETSYRAFNEKADSLAFYLQLRNVNRGDHIAILLPRSEEIFIAIMAVLKAGAAYVPIDPRSPEDRIKFILSDSHSVLLITDSALYKQNNITIDNLLIDEFDRIFSTYKCIGPSQCGATPDDTAYIIYTSGTTGKPKGVVIPHCSVCNLIRAEHHLFNVNSTDRVYQGFSVSFDASVEEMWLAWFSGALLVAATKSEALSGPDLSNFLQKEKITVFSTVPTQIAMMHKPVDSVRILILGGEECHLKSIEPWLNDSRNVFNTYGPTETTVIATSTYCKKDIKPSIGKPVPNYAIFLLDKNLQLVPPGLPGELCIGGHCLAREYLKRSELTAQKFIQSPFTLGHGFPDRLYRSGDRARFRSDGNIEFGGRIDNQVKLRGQRIELGEIESSIIKATNACQVAVAVVTNAQQIQSLVAYIVLQPDTVFDENGVRKMLQNFLPSYMIPNQFLLFNELPQLQSGKVDRKKLPSLYDGRLSISKDVIDPRTPAERLVLDIWKKYFDKQDISVTDDFFDIGGHSLLAATIISELRSIPGLQDLPLQYIYQFRTVESFAADCEKKIKSTESTLSQSGSIKKNELKTTLKRIFCGFFQAIALYPIFLLFSTPLLIPFIFDWCNPDVDLGVWLLTSCSAMIALFPAVIVVSIASKWIIIGKFKAGTYPLWGLYYLRFWFVCRVLDLVPVRLMRGTPILCWYYRLLGARIGKNVHLGTDRLRVSDMISIGDNSSINADVHCMAYTVSDGMLHIAPIQIGNFCTIGTRSVVSEDTKMEDNSELGELSLLPSGTTVLKNEYWEGSPAKLKTKQSVIIEPENYFERKVPFFYNVAFFSAFIFVILVPLVLLVPWITAAFELYVNYGLLYTLPFTVLMAAFYTVSYCLTIVVIKKIVDPPNKKSEQYPIYSYDYIRKWIVDTLVQLSLTTVQPIYATIFLPPWLRLLGAKIGKLTEISTVDHISADLLTIDDGSFIADSASVGPAVVKNGVMHVGKTSVGKKSFVGNSALVPIGVTIGDNCLIGVLSKPPLECGYSIIHNSDWLGSPPISLPKRQQNQNFANHQTFNPPRHMIFLRGFFEFFKITLPPALTSCCFIFSYWFLSEILGPVATLKSYILLCPVVIFAGTLVISTMTILSKWLLVGRYRQNQKPLWCTFIWRNEFINSLCENLVFPLLLQMIQGTPFLPWFFRCLGSRIGKNVYMDTTEITEFDLVRIDDNASLNYGCTIQTHLFEDRVMKMSSLHIGRNSTVGPMSVVLYDSTLKQGAELDGLSLLMKGETLPSSSSWFGIPARSKSTAVN
ncbi:MAG: amino acid adenylation domain-containing protein [Chitinispirillaceae bacterium]|nr:amino acid adenylation domain-containing protein [Chitinispirillaceae bacterium]